MEDSIISAVAPNIFMRCVGAARKHLGYIWNYKKNMANLQAQVKKLDEERADKNHSVIVAQKDTKKIKNRVKSWQDDADKTNEEATQIINYYKEKGQNKCLMGLCSNLISRYQFSKRACKKVTEIVDAIREAGEIKQVSDRTIGLGKEIALSMEGVLPFNSRESILDDIMKTLQDETKNLIGVYGFGGMGKTTLVKQVAKRADEEKMFEEIVFARVTQVIELKKIQERIASMLDLRLNNFSESESAGLIYGRLKEKKVLIILDDLWEELDLNNVGIPFGIDHMGCKILLTSRSLRVLSSMGTKKEFLLGALEEEEAWRLFEEKTIDVIKDPDFLTIGKKMAKRCAGLPVLIVTVAASLSKRPTLPAWNDALKQLKKMDNKQIHEIVNSAMKTISYNHLEQRHKQLFLLSALTGGNLSIECLLQYSLGLDMFDGEVVTMGEARNRLHAWIIDLKESCLLLDIDSQGDGDSIKMHDVIRDVAISIAEKDLNMFSVEGSGAELNICRRDGVIKRCTAIVCRGCPNLSCLPQQLECPSLELCILSQHYDESSFSIPNTFFEETINLKVLDMSRLYVSRLPSSLSLLKNLQTFRVDYCFSLKDISIVGELKKLQTLSFVGSGIEELPSGIGKLVELRLLDLSNCRELRIIPAGLIAGLSRLEELKMRGSFNRWDVEDGFNNNALNNSVRSNVSLSELNHLLKLTSLEIEVSNAKLLSKDLSIEKWEKYEIIVGDMWHEWRFSWWLKELEITRKVCLQLSTTSINHLQHVVEKLFWRTECLCLGELKGAKNVTPELDVDGFPYMKHLRIERDYDIQYIVNVEYKQHKASFPALESLHLSHLLELQKICNGRLMEESFYNLKVLNVEHCDKLESLFSFSMATGLRCLQEIQVSNCGVLEGIVAEKNKGDDDVNDGVCEKIEFVQLHKLSLKCLPKLNNFFGGKMVSIQRKRQNSLTTYSNSEEIVSDESKFKSFVPFFGKVFFPKLEELELSEISNLTQIWSHKLIDMPCCNLTRLTVENCDNLQYLLTPSVSMALVGLRDLIVKSCVKMKNIVAEEEGEGETKMETISFPQLTYLCLESLPNLTTFYSGSIEEGDPNENIDIAIQPLFNKKVKLPILKTLEIGNLDSIKIIWSPKSRSTWNKLEDIGNWEIPAYVVGALNKLEELRIRDCGVETIIGDDKDTEFPTFTFPKLVKFNLDGLSKLKCFYPREHTTQWPALAEFVVSGCDKIQPSMLPLFSLDKVTFPSSMSFKKLMKMEINSCAGLKYLFSPSMAMNLDKVRTLIITKCSMMKAVVSNEQGEATAYSNTIILSQLVHLKLKDLPKLRGFYSSVEEMYSNEKLDYDAQPLFNQKVSFPKLEKLELSEISNLTYIWSDKLSEMPCCNLTRLTVENCDNLQYLLTPSVMMALVGLQDLIVQSCVKMKNIVAEEKGEIQIGAICFPHLRYLCLESLPNLITFCSGSVEEMDPKESLDIAVQPLFNEKVQLPILETLKIGNLDGIKIIWPHMSRRTQNLTKQHPKIFSFQTLQQVEVCGCQNLEHVIPAYVVGALNKLERLSIQDCGVETIIGDDKDTKFSTYTFPKMVKLNLIRLSKLKCFYPREHTTQWPALEELVVSGCHKIQPSMLPLFSIEKVVFPSSMSFKKVLKMEIYNCVGLKYLFTPSIVMNLQTLQKLTVTKCSMMKAIVSDEEGEPTAYSNTIIFPQLTQLQLKDLPSITTFYSSVEEMDSNEKLDYDAQPLFNQKVSFPKLEELKLSKTSNLTHIWSHKLLEMPCINLTRLTVENYDNLSYLLTPSVSMALVGLRDLIVKSCAKMNSIVGEEEGETKMETICFPHLSYLCLESLPNLTTFYSVSVEEIDPKESFDISVQSLFHAKVKLPILKTLKIGNLDGIKILWLPMSRRTQNKLVDIGNRAIPAYVVGALNKLEELSIRDCGVETIIGDDKDTELPTFTFPKLVKFNLNGLSKLKCFYPREHTTQWPALEELVVSGCDQIQPSMLPLFSIEKVAFPTSMNFKNLLGIEINGCAGLKYLFTPSIAMSLHKVQRLTITKCSMMRSIVGNEGGEATAYINIIFPQLTLLRLEDMPDLAGFYSNVEDMDSNKKLDSQAQPLFNQKIQFPRLEHLSIAGLDSINSIWQNQQLYQVKEVTVRNSATRNQINLNESHEVFIFQNVREVAVCECKSLKCVFPVSVAQSLDKLEDLRVLECEELKTIIGDENYMETPEEVVKATGQVATTFTFPKLATLYLEKLPKLKCFYPREHTTEWPVLKVLETSDCGKMSAFDLITIREKQGDNQFEKVISKLESMIITSKEMIKILRLYDYHIRQPLFRSLKHLTITEFQGEATFPSKFLSVIHSQLQGFRVYNCSFQEIFSYEGEVIDHANSDVLLPQLKMLALDKLPELKYICKKERSSTFIPVLDKLIRLYVMECHCLTNLVPPSVSFKLLTYLDVRDCGGLISLISPSTATSLEHLYVIYISGCERVEEIIGEVKDDDEESSSFGHEIIFNKLWYLYLVDLPRLTNFSSSRSCTLHFPELQHVYVVECPNMKAFCGGITTTPYLRSVYLNVFGSEQRWGGDLNTTIEQMYAEREVKRLAITIPSIQIHENSAEGVSEARMNATNQEKVANIVDKGKGKEVEVSKEFKEHFEKSQETSRSSDPSCSNYATRGQTLTSYLTPPQHVGASSSQEVDQTLATSPISPNNQIEETVQSHDKPTEVLPEPRKKGKEMELCGNATEPIKGNEVGEEVTGEEKEVGIGSKAVKPVKPAATCGNVEEQTVAVSQATRDVGPSSSNSEQNNIQELHVTKHFIPLLSPALATQAEVQGLQDMVSTSSETPRHATEVVGTTIAASFSLQKDFQGLSGTEDIIARTSEYFQNLQALEMKSISMKQVQFMEEASEWLSGYVRQARECVEQTKVISELELKIAETEALLQALQEKKRAAQEIYEAKASSNMPRFG